MTTVSGDVRVRFHGFGSGGTAYEFTLNQPETSTSFPILLEPPSIPSSSIAPLDPSSSSSSLSVRLGYEAGSSAARAAVRELIAVDRLPLTDGAGGYVRTTVTVPYDATRFPLSDVSGLSDGDYIAIGGEVMEVDGAPSGSAIDVVRAQRGTFARVLTSFAGDGLPVYAERPASLVDCSMEVERDGSVVWRGFVRSVTERDGTSVTITARSILQKVREADYYPAKGQGYEVVDKYDAGAFSAGNGVTMPDEQPYFDVYGDVHGDADEYAAFEWDAARIQNGDGEFVCVPVTFELSGFIILDSGATRTTNRYRLNLSANFEGVYQVGKEGRTVEYPNDFARVRHIARVLNSSGAKVEFYPRIASGGNLSTIVSRLLGQSNYVGTSAGLPSAWINTALVSRGGVASLAAALRNEIDPVGTSHGFPEYRGRLLTLLDDYYTGPLFYGLAEGSGQIALVDWVPGETFVDHTITAADTTGGHNYETVASDAVSYIIYEFETETYRRDTRRVRTSDLNPRVARGSVADFEATVSVDVFEPQVVHVQSIWATAGNVGNVIQFGVGNLRRGARNLLRDRGIEAVNAYGRPIPTVSLECLPTTAVQAIGIGEIVEFTRADVPDADGSRGVVSVRGLCYQVATDLLSGAVGIGLLLVDAFTGALDVGRYAPSGEVSSWDSGTSTLTILANAYTDSGIASPLPDTDIDGFALALAANGGTSLDVILYDENGAERDTGTVTAVTTGANSMVVTWDGATTPVASDIVAIADSADNPTLRTASVSTTIGDRFAFLGDSSGDDAGGNDAPVYA